MKSMLMLVALAISAAAATASEFTVEIDENSSAISFYGKNQLYTDVTVSLSVETENLQGEVTDYFVFPAKASELLFVLKPTQKGRPWSYSYRFKYHLGTPDATQSEDAVYNLPFEKGTRVKGGQSFNGSFSHQGLAAFAVDFPVAEGTPVYPAREGLVVKVVEAFSEGGTEERLKPKGNVVWILHSDGTLGKYLHFMHQGVSVEPGQTVSRNTVLGLAGNTGYSSGPHLHFEVGAPNENTEFQSQEFFFSNNKGKKFSIKEGKTYRVDW